MGMSRDFGEVFRAGRYVKKRAFGGRERGIMTDCQLIPKSRNNL